MTVKDWLGPAQQKLKGAGILTARLDSLVLLEDLTGKDRGWLLAHFDLELTDAQVHRLALQIMRRAAHQPLAYIRHRTEFYGRQFYIDQRVLEPRPESETMIEMLKDLELDTAPMVVDVGTGSGALAITAKLEIPTAQVIAIDIDKHCLSVAQRNAKKLVADASFRQGDLLKPVAGHKLTGSSVVLLCNLPYVPDSFQINPAAMREPKVAIFGGPDGLEVYRRFFRQLSTLAWPICFVMTESLPPQHRALREIAESEGCRQLRSEDFIQLFDATKN